MATPDRETRHVDVTFTVEQHTRVVREAERRGSTLAGYIRERALSGAPLDVAALAADLAARMRDDIRVLFLAAVQSLAAVTVDAAMRAADKDVTTRDHRVAARDAGDLFTLQIEHAGRVGDVHGDIGEDAPNEA